MATDRIAARLRDLRRKAEKLNATITSDLRPFHVADGVFRRLPNRPKPKKRDVNASTSCTALMALCSNREFDSFFRIDARPEDVSQQRRQRVLEILDGIMRASWTSSGLRPDNAFTSSMILRTAGFVAHGHDVANIQSIARDWRGKRRTLKDIAVKLAEDPQKEFRLDESLRPSPALGYWLVDALDKLEIDLDDSVGVEAPSNWVRLARWAASEFTLQLSLVTARDAAIMDPVAMAMAACLSERLRAMASRADFSRADEVKGCLPTRIELEGGIELLFELQEPSGIWGKFFPMFYYRDPRKPGGANYCFTFEFLEAILNEFGISILSKDRIVAGLETACAWCESKRLQYSYNRTEYRGWNSAQQLDTVQLGRPESWATGVVHMFLRRLREVLAEQIQRQILEAYSAKFLQVRDGKTPLWERFISPQLEFANGKEDDLKEVVETEIVNPCLAGAGNRYKHLLVQDRPREEVRVSHRRSALLFGPPGTSKTTLVEAIAERLEWPFVEITPSHFLREGLEQIYEEANRIFEDLMDLSGVVILFDEMDALVQRRGMSEGRAQLDVTRQFLTTSMLPKLAKLHANNQVVFFMATNHRREFDEAILRPGRFDLLLCMGPPPWQKKKEGLKHWIGKWEDDRKKCERMITAWVAKKESVARMLDLFTYAEMQELFDHLRREYGKLNSFLAQEQTRDFDRLERVIRDWYEKMITLREGSETRTEYEQFDRRASRIQ